MRSKRDLKHNRFPRNRRRLGLIETLESRSLLAAGIIELGASDNIALDQPRVAVELAKDIDPGPGVVYESIGPGLFNTFLLDTGASSVLIMGNAIADMEKSNQGYDTQGLLLESGVAGAHLLDVSVPYRFDFAGTDGERLTLEDVRVMSDANNDFSQFGPWGLAGMPAMENRVTSLDMSGWSGGGGSNLDNIYMKTEFRDDVPADDGHRYTISLDNRLAFDPVDQMISGLPPVWGDVPFMTAVVEHRNVGQAGNFLFDTGAQISLLSERLAIDIGLDTNGDGELTSDDDSFVTQQVVGGVGGQISVPVFGFDEVHFPTDSGEDLVWTNLEWLVLDIELPGEGVSLDGVIGSDLLTSGWFHAFFSPGQPDGYINQIHMDFREMEVNGTGKVHFDLNPDVDVLIPPGPGIIIRQSFRTTDVGEGGETDSYDIVLTEQPTDDVTITLADPGGQVTAVNAVDGTNTLVFTPQNWETIQSVLVTAINDVAAEGNHTTAITHVVTSPDPGYDGRAVPDVTIRVTDDDLHLIEVTSDQAGLNNITSIAANEGGAEVQYWVAMSSQPSDEIWVLVEDVSGQSYAVNGANPQLGLENILVFHSGNWDIPQRVDLIAVDDVLKEGPHQTRMLHTILDITNFEEPIIGQSPLIVQITDDDLGDVVVTPSDGDTEVTESGATDTYQIGLNLPPSGTVQIDVQSDSQTEISGDGGQTYANQLQLSFNNTSAKTITVRAINDAVVEDTHVGVITHTVTGTVVDPKYPLGLSIGDIDVSIIDNDTAGLVISDQAPSESRQSIGSGPGTTIDLLEGGSQTSYWVTLTSQPQADVTLFLGDADDQATAVDANNINNAFLTFTSADWDTPKEVNASAVDDATPEGIHHTQLAHHAFSADSNYQGSVMLTANITDNDVGINVADASAIEGHSGAKTLTFDVTLTQSSSETVTVEASVSDGSATALGVERVASGLSSPVFATAAPGQADWLFIVEQTGQIELLNLQTNTVNATPFLTLSDLTSGGERGLLGLAFHPDYENNGLLYVYMTDSSSDTLIREYQANTDGMTADPASARPILGFDQPFFNHNGGWIGFGPDGYLYIGSGDGGSANDPQQNAQDITDNLLGKMLRIDVNGDDFTADPNRNYEIPPTNPFVGVTGDDEIWAYGLRNPWRSSFDRQTGDLFIGDVGQGIREEINVQPASSSGGENYGWRAREGTIATPSVGGPKPPGAIDPIYDYVHGAAPDQGFSVTGGYVYRGPIEELQGNYFFADYVRNRIWSLRYNGDAPTAFAGTNFADFTDWTNLLAPDVGQIRDISSFGEDAAGNLYIVDHGGEVFRISQGADYLSTTQSVTFTPGVISQSLDVQVLGDRLQEPQEQLVVTLSNPTGDATIVDGTAIGAIIDDDAPAPQVVDVQVNRDEQQRSFVDEVVVTFDSIVEIDVAEAPAFEFVNRETQETADHTPSISNASGATVVTFNFLPGATVVARDPSLPTLADGNYELRLASSMIHVGAVLLDGNGDGTGGDNYVFGDQEADAFFRFYGDNEGDRDSDAEDLGQFGLTFRSSNGDANYDPIFDHDGDGDVDALDLDEFGQRFRTMLPF